MRHRIVLLVWLAVCVFGFASSTLWAQTPAIDVQFSHGTTFTGAAVIGSGGDAWNKMTTASGGPVSLNNVSGASTPVNISWASVSLVNGTASGFAATIYANLMTDYLATLTSNNITFSGLAQSQAYTLYVYTQGDTASTGRELTVTPAIGSAVTSTATVSAQNTFVSGQNYLIVNATTDGSGNLSLTYTSAALEGDLNAIQLVGAIPSNSSPTPVPFMSPASMILLVLLIAGSGCLWLTRTSYKSAA